MCPLFILHYTTKYKLLNGYWKSCAFGTPKHAISHWNGILPLYLHYFNLQVSQSAIRSTTFTFWLMNLELEALYFFGQPTALCPIRELVGPKITCQFFLWNNGHQQEALHDIYHMQSILLSNSENFMIFWWNSNRSYKSNMASDEGFP